MARQIDSQVNMSRSKLRADAETVLDGLLLDSATIMSGGFGLRLPNLPKRLAVFTAATSGRSRIGPVPVAAFACCSSPGDSNVSSHSVVSASVSSGSTRKSC